MGTGVSRIEQEFVLTAVQEKNIPVQVHGNRQETGGKIVAVTGTELVLELESPLKTLHDERLRVFFSYFGHVMTFSARFRSSEENRITVTYPKGLYRNLQRKYERVIPPSGTKAYFTLSDTKVELSFPKSEEYNPVERPQLSERFKPESIAGLLKSFRDSVAERSDDNRVAMFRDRQPSGYEEEMIARTGKTLLISASESGLPEEEEDHEGRFITREFVNRGGGELGAPAVYRENFAAVLNKKRQAGIVSEIYSPILFHEYVIGYVYLASKSGGFKQTLIDEIFEFCQVLAYSLKINNYFKGADVGSERYETQILNLSASGILFTHDSPKLKESLMIYTDVPIHLQIKNRKMKIGGRIMRKFEDATTCYYGVQFLDVQPEDFRYLFEMAYGRPFESKDADLWEGGTEPPPLEF